MNRSDRHGLGATRNMGSRITGNVPERDPLLKERGLPPARGRWGSLNVGLDGAGRRNRPTFPAIGDTPTITAERSPAVNSHAMRP